MVTLLDGGMGTELVARGVSKRGGLWSAQALLDAPEVVAELHRDYIAAGSTIITTNTYSTVPSYLDKAGIRHRLSELAALAGQLAQLATKDTSALVAGSLPPLQESYRPDLVQGSDDAVPVYLELAQALQPFVDVFLCETMSSVQEAKNAATAALTVTSGTKKPVYVSFTLDDEPGAGLRSRETLRAAVEGLEDLEISGFLVNCSRPEGIDVALKQLSSLTNKPIGCYANRMDRVPDGWTLDGAEMIEYRNDLSVDIFAEWGLRSVQVGASMVGGCCGTGPQHIVALRDALVGASRRTPRGRN